MASCLASCQPAPFIIPTPTISFQMRGHSVSLRWERTVRPLERQLRQQMLFLLLRSTLRCPHRELWELNGSISHFPLAASKRPILLLPCSFFPPSMRRTCFGFTDHPVYNSCKTGYSGACHPCYSSMAQ